jgi:mannose-1-phosphate guanylyltransferase/mannose-6-phosphate isomerase
MGGNQILPVILSGGAGTRLWPLSRNDYPKQFLALTSDLSLFQETLKRLNGIHGALPPMVVCNEGHRFLIAEQAQAIEHNLSAILLEPAAKNTAPAIALAALKAREGGNDPLLLVLPSDHVFSDAAVFHTAVAQAAAVAHAGHLVTFGIVPSHPETGFGYIQAGAALAEGGMQVARFVEKPNRDTAQSYIDAGGYFWNSGMFLFKASAYLDELATHKPAMLQACTAALAVAKTDLDFCRVDAEAFNACPADSVDYAVMEKTQRAAVVPLNAGWNDVGAWTAVREVNPQDAQGNASHGDVLLHDASNSYAYAKSRLVCLLGVDNLTVVETPDVVLVAHNDRAQDVKQLVDHLKTDKRSEATMHREVHRPWGHYDSIDEGKRFKVKRITVKPGEKLSVQMHYHRAEHWVVVTGTALVRVGDSEKLVTENESIFIPIGGVHSLENPGKVPLELIEVQTGSYLGEDDIVRFEDRYGRVGTQG